MTAIVGSKLGPYEILARVGAGGMGEVFRAKDTRLGRDVAVKILPELFAADSDRLRRFEQEARSAAALNHPNILVVYDVGADAGVPYVVSELLEGQTLRQVLEGGPLPPRKAVEYGIQLAGGLAAAHDKGIIHRDVKPENVFVTKDGRLKILDFGLAKLAEAATTDGSRATMANTDPGTVVGTAGYMSPEQLRAETVDARSDVFSLGAVLYEMFTGTRAFKGKTAVDTMSAILKEDPADFPSAVHASSPAVERIVRRCLEKSVEQRFQSARDVTFALEAISTASGVGLLDSTAVKTRRTRSWARVGIAGGLVIASGAAYVVGARFGAKAPDPPALAQLTFRNGDVRGARFSPDGKTVIYAAAWGADPLTVFTMRPGSPESGPLNLPPADVLAVSSSSELALSLNPILNPFVASGTLARVSLSGGAPRELVEDAAFADWSPDGRELAVTFGRSPSHGRLEFPLGVPRVDVPYWLSNVRISPDGAQAAFIGHLQGGDDGDIEVIGRSGPPRTISRGWLSLEGLAWAPGGREIWFSGTRAGMLRGIWAVTLDGLERLVYRAPVRLTLEDVSPDGRALVIAVSVRSEIRFGSLKQKTERSLSWFDFATGLSMSDDARFIAFIESGEGAGSKYGVFVRPTDGGPAVRLADGAAAEISPDGKWVMNAGLDLTKGQATLIPIGPGAAREIDVKPVTNLQGGKWSSDGRRFLVVGNEIGRPARTYAIDVQTGKVAPITPENTRGLFMSPDGQLMAALQGTQPGVFNLRTQAFTPLPGSPRDLIAGWSADSRSFFVVQNDLRTIHLFQIDAGTGTRTDLGTLSPSDPAGLTGVGGVLVAPDGDHYVYHYFRQLSQLFLVNLAGR